MWSDGGTRHGAAENRFVFRALFAIHRRDQAGRGTEGEHATRGDRIFFAGLWIASNTRAFRSNAEGAEGPQFHGLAAHERIADLVQRLFDDVTRLRARKSR